jgi:hypothetical protein
MTADERPAPDLDLTRAALRAHDERMAEEHQAVPETPPADDGGDAEPETRSDEDSGDEQPESG